MTEEQWLAIEHNDKRYDGQFFYALKTTKNVCRPSCTARACNPKNVIIFDTLETALEKGFRPCRRCRPELPNWKGPKADLAKAAKKWIYHHYTEKFSLETMGKALYTNSRYLLRVFKAETGKTLLWYHNYTRCVRAKVLLAQQKFSISQISWTIGYATPSHFTRIFKDLFGCTPSEYRTDSMQKQKQYKKMKESKKA